MDPKRLGEILGELRAGYERIYGPRLVDLVLFGSQARGDADPDSDIDLMVVLHGPLRGDSEREQADRLKADVCLEHEIAISALYMSEESFRTELSPLMLNVRREGVSV